MDDSYFGGRRKGKRGRGASVKIPVFGMLKRGGKVYTNIIPDTSGATLAPIIERKIAPSSIVYSDSWRGVQTLSDQSFGVIRGWLEPHQRVQKLLESGEAPFAQIQWRSKREFYILLKECEWRFNNYDPKHQLSKLKQWVKEHTN